MLTRKGITNLLKQIFETGGLTDEMETLIQRLQSDFDEREGILKKYGKEYDDESDEYEFEETKTGNTTDFKKEYDELRGKYLDRFFNGDEKIAKDNDIPTEKEEISDEVTFDDLLKIDEKEKE